MNYDVDNPFTRTSLFICERGIDSLTYPYRVADVDPETGRFTPFVLERGAPYSFNNRNRFLPKHAEGRSKIFCARWNAICNEKDPEKDFVLPQFEEVPPMVFGINRNLERYSLREVAQKLKENVPDFRVQYHPVLFMVREKSRVAILCTPEDVCEGSGGTLQLKSGVYVLPYYRLGRPTTSVMGNSICYDYYPVYGDIGVVKAGLCPTTSRYEQVRDYIQANYLTKAGLKDVNASRAEYHRINEIFKVVRPKINIAALSKAISCTEEEARSTLDAIFWDLDMMEQPGDIDEAFVEYLISKSDKLKNHFLETWARSHSSDLAAAEKILNDKVEAIEKQTAALQDSLARKVESCNTEIAAAEKARDKQIAAIKSEVEKERLAAKDLVSELEKKIADREADAAKFEQDIQSKQKILDCLREETSSLLSQTNDAVTKVLVTAQVARAVVPSSVEADNLGGATVVQSHEVRLTAFSKGNDCPPEQIEDASAWELLNDNLQECGVVRGVIKPLAAVLLASYRLKMPILLAGPGGKAVADALSCAVNAAMPDELACEWAFNPQALETAFSGDAGVLVIRGGINSSWTEAILERTNSSSRMPIFILPISDDLAMVPKGVLDYVVALDLQLLVKYQMRGYVDKLIGTKAKFTDETVPERRMPEEGVLRRILHCSPTCESNLKQVASLASTYTGEALFPVDFAYSAIYYPMARIMDVFGEFCELYDGRREAVPTLNRYIVKKES